MTQLILTNKINIHKYSQIFSNIFKYLRLKLFEVILRIDSFSYEILYKLITEKTFLLRHRDKY